MRLILENVELHVNPDGKTVTIDTSNAKTRLETEAGEPVVCSSETKQDDYSDIRPGDIVEFDDDGEHCGPTACFEDEDGDWYIKDENGNEGWFICHDGIPFSDDIGNIVIHRELRTKEPEDPGLYITQSGRMVVKDDRSDTFDLFRIDETRALCANWEYLISIIKESELPLRKAKAVAEC